MYSFSVFGPLWGCGSKTESLRQVTVNGEGHCDVVLTLLSVPWSLRPRNRAAAATCGLKDRTERVFGKGVPDKAFHVEVRGGILCDFCK